jgi:hypothetical protein
VATVCRGLLGQRPPGQVAEEDEQIRIEGDDVFGHRGESDRVAVRVGRDSDTGGPMPRHAEKLAGSQACDHFFVLSRRRLFGN